MPIDYADLIKRGGHGLVPADCEVLERTVRECKPRSLLEIGARDGSSTMLFLQLGRALGGSMRLTSIEPRPTQIWAENMRRLRATADELAMITGHSPWIDPRRVAQPIDYLFIDGAHLTRWVLVDYHYWQPHVRVGGMVALHDRTHRGVRRAIDIILESDRPLLELVADLDRRPSGLMVWRKVACARNAPQPHRIPMEADRDG